MRLDRIPSRGAAAGGLDSRDLAFVEMLRAFRSSGGLARAQDIQDRARCGGVISPSVCGERPISFEWKGQLWLPRFQFGPEGFKVRPEPASVMRELATVFDGWDMANWFSQPNLWLADARPVDLLDRSLPDVIGAARADRFVAAG
jgi:hypothetical protein